MWARLLDILKLVWQNPVVKFAVFTIVEWLYLFLKKDKKVPKKTNQSADEYNVGTDNNTESTPAEIEEKEYKKPVSVTKEHRIGKKTKHEIALEKKVTQAKIKSNRKFSKRVVMKEDNKKEESVDDKK